MKKIYSSRYAVRGIRRDCCCCCYSCYVPPVNRVLPHCKLTLVLLLYRGRRETPFVIKALPVTLTNGFVLGSMNFSVVTTFTKTGTTADYLYLGGWSMLAGGAVMPVSTGVPGVKMSVNVSDALFGDMNGEYREGNSVLVCTRDKNNDC